MRLQCAIILNSLVRQRLSHRSQPGSLGCRSAHMLSIPRRNWVVAHSISYFPEDSSEDSYEYIFQGTNKSYNRSICQHAEVEFDQEVWWLPAKGSNVVLYRKPRHIAYQSCGEAKERSLGYEVDGKTQSRRMPHSQIDNSYRKKKTCQWRVVSVPWRTIMDHTRVDFLAGSEGDLIAISGREVSLQ